METPTKDDIEHGAAHAADEVKSHPVLAAFVAGFVLGIVLGGWLF